jgi:hypothetical protein
MRLDKVLTAADQNVLNIVWTVDENDAPMPETERYEVAIFTRA